VIRQIPRCHILRVNIFGKKEKRVKKKRRGIRMSFVYPTAS